MDTAPYNTSIHPFIMQRLKFLWFQALLWIAMNILVFLIASATMVIWVKGAGGMFGIPVFFAAYSPVYAAISGVTILRLRASG